MYVVITDFNGHAQTRHCLDTLLTHDEVRVCAIVVDHGTKENTGEMLRKYFPEALVLRDSPAKWWSGATNTGIAHALKIGAKTLMLLNSDCYLDEGTLKELLDLHLLYPDAIIAPVQRDLETGHVRAFRLHNFFLLGFPTLTFSRRITERVSAKRVIKTGLIAGGRGVIVPKCVFEKIGLLDEKHLPHYGADHDFYLRAKKKGIPLLIALRATVRVDNTRTSLASTPGQLSFDQLLETLSSAKSHVNIRHVSALFKKHYPIKGVYWFGVMLYISRYALLCFIRNGIRLISKLVTKLIFNFQYK